MKGEGSFYYVPSAFYERSLFVLLEKILSTNQRALVRVKDETRASELDDVLWKIKQESFLPHGAQGDDMAEPALCPIWISFQDDNPNDSTILLLLDDTGDDQIHLTRHMALVRDDVANALHHASQLWHKWQNRDWTVNGFHQASGQKSWQKLSEPLGEGWAS